MSTHAASSVAASAAQAHAPRPGPGPVPGSVDDVLARGHVWLRFPAALEAQFRADTLEPRRRLLAVCALIGLLGILLGSVNSARLLPDIAELAQRIVANCLAAGVLSLLAVWFTPVRWRRHWHAEALTFANTFGLCVVIIWVSALSRVDTAFTHSVTMIGPVMYACIAARQRFVWACTCALLSLLGYAVFVHGHTPQQNLIVTANLRLMGLSFAFVLVANYALEHRERRNWLLRKLGEQQRGVLVETSERLRRLSIQDPLTGLLNRRQFDADVGLAWSRAAFVGEPVCMLMLDVDFFKRYNDSYGHPAGDACLIQVAQVLTEVADEHGGIAARLGGEEFGLLLPGATLSAAQQAAEALCDGVRARRIEHRTSAVGRHVTVSVGVAQLWPNGGGSAQALLAAADRALYRAKAAGRDGAQVEAADSAESGGVPGPEAPQAASAASASATETDPATGATVVAWPEPLASPEPPEAAYLRTLHGGLRWLRFAPDQEAAYRQHNADQRRVFLSVMAVLGLIIYNSYVLTSRASFPDIRNSVLIGQTVLSGVMLLLTLISLRLKTRAWWREALFSLGIGVIAVGSSWILAQSRELSALSFAVSLVLVPMFSGVGAQQPFWFTCVPAVTTLVAIELLFKPVGALPTLVFKDSAFVIANSTLYTLILAYTLEYGARKEWLFARIGDLQREALAAASQRLHRLSMLDPLTAISNRRQFEDDFQRAWNAARHERQTLALLIIDVDFFKRYNDHYGHPVGDRCLRQVASAINLVALEHRGGAARLGGEEFGVLLPGAGLGEAERVGEQICAAVRQLGIEHGQSAASGTVTVSVGAASVAPAKGLSRRALFAVADDALYQAKSSGRDRVVALLMPAALPMPAAGLDLPAVA